LKDNWKKRYFTISDTRVNYHENEKDYDKDKESLGYIELNTIKAIEVPSENLFTPKTQGFVFQIVTPQRTYSLLAVNEEELNAWVTKLREAVSKVPPKIEEEVPLSPRERERRAKKEKAEEDKKKKEKEKEEKKRKKKKKKPQKKKNIKKKN